MGDRLFTSPRLRRVAGPLDRAKTTLQREGGMAVLGGRFVAVVRALMPAAAGAARVPYRKFAIHNTISGVVWGVGYSLLGYLAGSAYVAVERTVGAGLAIAIAVLVVAAAGIWAWRRHRRLAAPAIPGTTIAVTANPGSATAGSATAGSATAGSATAGSQPPVVPSERVPAGTVAADSVAAEPVPAEPVAAEGVVAED